MSGFDYFSIADVKVMEIYSLCMALEKLSERPSKRKNVKTIGICKNRFI